MSDLALDGAASPQQRFQLWRQAAAGAADQDLRSRYTIAAIHDGQIRDLAGQDRNLPQGFGQCAAIVGISRQGAHARDDALVDGWGQTNLGAELAALAGFAL